MSTRVSPLSAICPRTLTADVAEPVRRDMDARVAWVIADAESVVGFAVIDRRGPDVAEILWAAVANDRRKEGLGSLLIQHVLDALQVSGVRVVEVNTLDASCQLRSICSNLSILEGMRVRSRGHNRPASRLADGKSMCGSHRRTRLYHIVLSE